MRNLSRDNFNKTYLKNSRSRLRARHPGDWKRSVLIVREYGNPRDNAGIKR